MDTQSKPVGKRKPGMTANPNIEEPPVDDEPEEIFHSQLFIARPTGSVAPHSATGGHQNWNKPRSNIWKTLATFWSFFVMGANDSASGRLVSYLHSYYKLSYLVVSLIFLSPLAGYAIANVIGDKVYTTIGRRGVVLMCPLCHLLAYTIDCFHPPYHALVVAFIVAGMANGLPDSAWNAWAGSMDNASQLLGILHAFFGLGAVLTPLIISSLVAHADYPGYFFYYVMIIFSVVELIISLVANCLNKPSPARRVKLAMEGERKKRCFSAPFLELPGCALASLGSVGIEVALEGWVVTFMQDAQNAAEYASSLTATGFWFGLLVGILVLGFITPLIGENCDHYNSAAKIYIVLQIVFSLIVWLVPVRLLPEDLHVTVIRVTTGFSSLGAALLPFLVGAIADTQGINFLQLFILGLSGAIIMLWVCFPRIPRMLKNSKEEDSEC